MNDDIKKLIADEVEHGDTDLTSADRKPTLEEKIGAKVENNINSEASISKYAKKLTAVSDNMVINSIEKEANVALRGKADNSAVRQQIKNDLFELRQEKKRLTKEQKFLNSQQKSLHRHELKQKNWETYGKTLSSYGFDSMPNSFVAKTILFLDAAKGFLEGINKVNNKLIKAMKYFIIAGLIIGVVLIIPSFRKIIFDLFGFK